MSESLEIVIVYENIYIYSTKMFTKTCKYFNRYGQCDVKLMISSAMI